MQERGSVMAVWTSSDPKFTKEMNQKIRERGILIEVLKALKGIERMLRALLK